MNFNLHNIHKNNIHENNIQFYSQQVDNCMTDKILFEKFINVKNCNGVFLELGACDGVYLSNTYALEKYLGFTGVLIEPGEKFFNNLIKNRPNCKNFNYLVGTNEGEIDYIGDATGVGGALHILEKTHDYGHNYWIDTWKLNKNNITKVSCRKLSDILKEANIKYIDFWSLDVEGAELEVLKTMDWSIPVYFICMEVTAWGEIGKQNIEECRQILRANGFTTDGKRYGLDEFWINENYFRKNLLFSNNR
jgi:FkbM family methyltransferase